MTIHNYIVPHNHLDPVKILIHWKWLIGEDKEIMVLTKMGDLLLKDPSNKLYFLSAGEGTFEHISNYHTDFFKNKLSAEQYFEIFLPELIEDLEQDGKLLKDDEVYTYLKVPANEGQYDINNIYCTDIYKHFKLTGALHKQLSDLQDEQATKIRSEE